MAFTVADKFFKASLLKQVSGLMDVQRAHGAQDDAYSLATAKYYEPLLIDANQQLKTYRSTAPARLRPALSWKKRHELMGVLGARLEFYAWEYHKALAVPNYGVIPNPTAAEIEDLCGTAAVPTPVFLVRQAVMRIRDQFITYITTVLNHVDADWNDIGNVFFPLWNVLSLQELGASGSDSHKEGKSVVILAFEGKSLPPHLNPVGAGNHIANFIHFSSARRLKLVYKPSDLSIDYFWVADTAGVTASLGAAPVPPPPGGSLFEVLNADAAIVPPLNLPIYRILPRNPGNLLTGYGYIEFLEHGPNAEPHGATFVVQRLRTANAPHWDWITMVPADLATYYRVFGWYAALGMNLGMADAHNQNVMVHNKLPHLIDLEICFKWITESIGKTGLQDVMSSPGPSQAGDWCQMFYFDGATLQRTTGTTAATHIKNAIQEGLAYIRLDAAGHIRNWLTSPALANCLVRYTPQATREFGRYLRATYTTAAQANPGTMPAGGMTPYLTFARMFMTRTWYQSLESEQRPNFALGDPLHDFQCYLNCDYPVYYRRLNSMDLLNARNVVANVATPAFPTGDPQTDACPVKNVAGAHYFDHYPSVHLFTIVDYTTQPAPGNTFARLNANVGNDMVADLSAAFAAGVPAVVITNAAVTSVEKVDEQWRLIEGGRIFHVRRTKDATGALTNELTAWESGDAISMVTRQLDRLQDVNIAFHNRMLADAQAYVDSLYPTAYADGMAVFNGF